MKLFLLFLRNRVCIGKVCKKRGVREREEQGKLNSNRTIEAEEEEEEEDRKIAHVSYKFYNL